MSDLQDTIARIASNATLLVSSEEATRQAAILPILSELGWAWHNIDEVVPEYRVGDGRVDYCLRVRGHSTVFIEVKRAGTDLQPHQPQLLEYAFREGVQLAALTDGLVWWLYLPTAEGSWEQRRFFSLDATRVSAERAAEILTSFLAHDAVVSGDAVSRARAEFASLERERRIAEAFPIAWRQLTQGPDELLVDLVSEAVAGIAGHSPDAEAVARFLGTLPTPPTAAMPVILPPTVRRAKASPPTDIEPPSNRLPVLSSPVSAAPAPDQSDYQGTVPVKIVLDGVEYAVGTWRDVLATVCNYLAERSNDFAERALPLKGRKRSYFSRSGEDLTRPLKIERAVIFVESNLSANNIVNLCRRVISQVPGEKIPFEIRVDSEAPIRRRQRGPANHR